MACVKNVIYNLKTTKCATLKTIVIKVVWNTCLPLSYCVVESASSPKCRRWFILSCELKSVVYDDRQQSRMSVNKNILYTFTKALFLLEKQKSWKTAKRCLNGSPSKWVFSNIAVNSDNWYAYRQDIVFFLKIVCRWVTLSNVFFSPRKHVCNNGCLCLQKKLFKKKFFLQFTCLTIQFFRNRLKVLSWVITINAFN